MNNNRRLDDILESVERLDGTALKLIAVVAMFCDHFAFAVLGRAGSLGWLTAENSAALDRTYMVLRSIGRLSFPIFAYFIVEGFCHTRNRRRYLLRLGLFALLSELPFDLAVYGEIYWQYQNVYFILAMGVLMLELFERLPRVWYLPVLGAGCVISWALHFDYMAVGLVLMAVFYWCRGNRLRALTAGFLCFIWEPWSIAGFLLLLTYNGQRGRGMKYFFYLFYPVHLLFLYVLWRYLL